MNYPIISLKNQGKENPHDKVKPSISALIIRKHVTEGLDGESMALRRRSLMGSLLIMALESSVTLQRGTRAGG